MTARVIAITGPARSGKTARVLARYREALAERVPQSTLWLAPAWRAAAAIRDRLLQRGLDACFSPAVMTFDRFAEAVLNVSAATVRPLTRPMKRQLVRLVLDEQLQAGRIQRFLPIAGTGGLVDQLCELISELKRLDVWPDTLREACRSRGMTQKDAELLAVYEAYQEILNEHQLYDAEGRFWWARMLLKDGQRRPFERLRLVVADGFTDFTPPQHEILQVLAGWVEELWITLPLEAAQQRPDLFGKPLNTLAELRRRHPGLEREHLDRPTESPAWPAMDHLERTLFLNPRLSQPAPDTCGIEIVAASRQLGEIELIGSRIKRLLTQGCQRTGGRPVRPGDVAVVFRSLGDVEGLVREVFGKLGIPFALESSPSLDQSTAVGALAALVHLDAEDWPFRKLVAVLTNNYFQPDWPEWENGLAGLAAERAIRRLQIPRGRDPLLRQLRLEAERRSPGDDAWSVPAAERNRQAQAALGLLVRLKQAFDALPERATLGEWADAWQSLAKETGLVDVMERGGSRAESNSAPSWIDITHRAVANSAAWQSLQDALGASDLLARLVGRTPRRLNRQEALAALSDIVRSTTARQGAEESGRVRVLSAPSVRALQIPYLFVAGLAERSFPPPDRQDRLYTEAECRRLIDEGLPLVARTERNREEMLLFYEVTTRASQRACFSYPGLDEAAQPLAPSPYLEEVEQGCGAGRIARTLAADLSPVPAHDDPLTAVEFRVKAVSSALEGDVSLLSDLVGREPAPGVAGNVLAGLKMVDARRDRNEFGPTEGILGGEAARQRIATHFGPTWTFSATELEQYASCPFRFFADRVLGIEPLEELGLAVDYLARGHLVHAALADFHGRVNAHGGGPTSPAALDEEDYQRLLGETLQWLGEHRAASPLDAALREVDCRLWTQWASDYRKQHGDYDGQWQGFETPPSPAWFEVSFGHSGGSASPLSTERPLELPARDGVIRIAGRIDRIDVGQIAGTTVFNIVDYKTGRSTRFSREAVAAGTALQLPLYATATQELLLADRHAVPWQAGYWLLRDGGFKSRQSLKMYHRPGGQLEPEADWEELRQTVVDTVGALVAAIREGRFPVYSADEECARFCPLRTVCRINQVRSLEKTWALVPSQP